MEKKVKESANFLKDIIGDFKPRIAIVLGSGFGEFVDEIDVKYRFSYSQIPNFVSTSVIGHKGELVFGYFNGVEVVVLAGRIHYYEGYPMHQIVFPIYVLNELGIKTLILTNAVGAINPNFRVQDLIAVSDHINLTGSNPLIGKQYDYIGLRFPSLFDLYSTRLNNIFLQSAQKNNISMKQGVFLQTFGPSYETKAEIKFYSICGADIVGMSSAMEAISAKHCGLEVALISFVTNMACGIEDANPNIEEVISTADIAKSKITTILKDTIQLI